MKNYFLINCLSVYQYHAVVYSNLEKDEPFESMKEMEAHTIGNLLPDEDGLFSRVINEVEVDHISLRNNNNADDLFYIGGGMEYENNGVPNIGEFIYSTNPSRTLFVNYIENLDDADLRALFEVNVIFNNHTRYFMNLNLYVCCLMFSRRNMVTFTCFIHLVNIMVLLSFTTMILGQLSIS